MYVKALVSLARDRAPDANGSVAIINWEFFTI
jgi:hypothetical protein